jgi:hypothetical protein
MDGELGEAGEVAEAVRGMVSSAMAVVDLASDLVVELHEEILTVLENAPMVGVAFSLIKKVAGRGMQAHVSSIATLPCFFAAGRTLRALPLILAAHLCCPHHCLMTMIWAPCSIPPHTCLLPSPASGQQEELLLAVRGL